jgi:hypothetical protein
MAVAATKPQREDTSSEDGGVEADHINVRALVVGLVNKAAVIAARRAYVASAASDDNDAAASAARRTHATMAA